MTESASIETLIQAARTSKASKDVLLPQYRGYLRVLAGLQVGRRLAVKADASDLVQETLLHAHMAFEQFQGTTEKQLLGWLRTILTSRVLQLIRQQTAGRRDHRLEQQLDADLDASADGLAQAIPASIDSPSQQVVRREVAVVLANALQQLSADHRDVIALHHVQGLPFKQVGERLGRSEAAARKLWLRALVKLRDILASHA